MDRFVDAGHTPFQVAEDFRGAKREFAEILGKSAPADQNEKSELLKRGLAAKLGALRGKDRECYAAAWFEYRRGLCCRAPDDPAPI